MKKQKLTSQEHIQEQQYTPKNWSGWCNIVRWTTYDQYCYHGWTTLLKHQSLTTLFYQHCSLLTIEQYCCVAVGTGVNNIDRTTLLIVVRTMLFSIVKWSCFNNIVGTVLFSIVKSSCFNNIVRTMLFSIAKSPCVNSVDERTTCFWLFEQ